jgi:hypothetical protein
MDTHNMDNTTNKWKLDNKEVPNTEWVELKILTWTNINNTSITPNSNRDKHNNKNKLPMLSAKRKLKKNLNNKKITNE